MHLLFVSLITSWFFRPKVLAFICIVGWGKGGGEGGREGEVEVHESSVDKACCTLYSHGVGFLTLLSQALRGYTSLSQSYYDPGDTFSVYI